MSNEFIKTITNAEYHRDGRISASGLKQILRSPMHYKFNKENPRPPTRAMEFGTLMHTAILEPELLAASYVVVPDDAPTKQSRAGKEWWVLFNQDAGDKIVINSEQQKAMTSEVITTSVLTFTKCKSPHKLLE